MLSAIIKYNWYKKDSPFPSDREELADFLRELFSKARTILGNLFRQGQAFLGDFLEQRKEEGFQHWRKGGRARKALLVLSHWHKGFDDWQESVQRVYTSVEEEIKRRKIPDVKTSRIFYREGGILSAKREYLRVRRREHIFDICAAPFGTGYFFSWWLGETPGFFWRLILWIPILGGLLVRLFRPETYYRLDTALMFQGAVHSAVLRVIELLTEGKGVRALSEEDKKPIMSDLFSRKLK
jgi:hypothetical protein